MTKSKKSEQYQLQICKNFEGGVLGIKVNNNGQLQCINERFPTTTIYKFKKVQKNRHGLKVL